MPVEVERIPWNKPKFSKDQKGRQALVLFASTVEDEVHAQYAAVKAEIEKEYPELAADMEIQPRRVPEEAPLSEREKKMAQAAGFLATENVSSEVVESELSFAERLAQVETQFSDLGVVSEELPLKQAS